MVNPSQRGTGGFAMTSGKFWHRYSPLVVLGVIQLVVILLAPSKSPVISASSGSGATSGGVTLGGSSPTGPSGSAAPSGPAGASASGTSDSVAGAAGAPGAVGSTGAASSATGGDSQGGPAATTAATSAGGTVIGSTSPNGTVSACRGTQFAGLSYTPPCIAFSGTNGGATMQGVTAKQIQYVWYESVVSPVVAAAGAALGLGYTKDQLCAAMSSFTDELNKRWQLYGRHFVSLNGPGSHSGMAQGNNCHYPYYQGQSCSLAPDDPACWRADADVIATMKPAVVFASVETDAAFMDELARHHVLVLGQGNGAGDNHAWTVAHSPYTWDQQMSADTLMTINARYFCQKLVGRPVQFAGNEVVHPNGPVSPAPIRKVAILYDASTPDLMGPVIQDKFVTALNACGAQGTKVFPFDPGASSSQLQTLAAELKQGRFTTIDDAIDPISNVTFTNDLANEGYHPEIVISGAGAIDDDLFGQLSNKSVWRYAFGPSLTDFGIPLSQTDPYAAWVDSGRTGAPFKLSINMWPYFWMMGDMFQMAGPSPTIDAIKVGTFNMPIMGGDPLHQAKRWGVAGDEYDGGRDVREVYYCSTQKSRRNDGGGAYIGVDGDRRWQLGQIDATMRVFPNGPC